MSDTSTQPKDHSLWRNALVGIVAAALGSTGGVFGYMKLDPQRNDTVTHQELSAMRTEILLTYRRDLDAMGLALAPIVARQNSNDERFVVLQRRVDSLPPPWFRGKVEAIEDHLIRTQPDFAPHRP